MKPTNLFTRIVHLTSIAFMIIMASVWVRPLLLDRHDIKEIESQELLEFLSKHRVGSSPDYAVVKNGHDYLAVIFGFADDYSTCMGLIKANNDDPLLSVLPGTYQCVALNE